LFHNLVKEFVVQPGCSTLFYCSSSTTWSSWSFSTTCQNSVTNTNL